MPTQTPNYSLKKPTDADNADLKVFVGENMDTIDTELAKKIDKDPTTGRVKATDLPTASGVSKGAVQIGNGLAMSGDYVFVKTGEGLQVDSTTSEVKVKPATASTVGGVKVGTGLEVTADGTINVTASGGQSVVTEDGAFGNYKIQFNATTNTLDFVYVGA